MTLAELHENLLVGFDTLRSHKVRTLLTVLGIVIGVTSVIAVAAIIEGLNQAISDRVHSIGSGTYFITRIPLAIGFGRLPARIRTRKYLDFRDSARLEEMVPSISYATSFSNRPQFAGTFSAMDANVIQYGSERVEQVIVRGVEPRYIDAIPLFAVAEGRFISNYDAEHSRAVAVIGVAIAEALFPHTDPIGKQVRLNGKQFEVIGVFDKDPGLFGGPGVDQFVCIPLTVFRKHYPEIREVFIAFNIPPGADAARVQNDVMEAMRRIRRVPLNGENDFEISSPEFLTNLWNQLTSALFILTAVISSIGLLVGGVGVMNIMLISVTERTREIGVRKAVGARRADIRVQFLLEAVTLTLAGGILGILLGIGIAAIIRSLLPSVPAAVSYVWIALGVAMSVSVGIFFGFYPANRAANLDPIVCLRYE